MNLEPFVGIGNIHFGMLKKEIRALLDEPHRWFEEEIDTYFEGWYQPQRDYFKGSGIKIEYDEQDCCTFIEIDSKTNLVYNGVLWFKIPYHQLISTCLKIDPDLEVNKSNFASSILGVSVVAGQEEDFKNLPAKLIAAFPKGEI